MIFYIDPGTGSMLFTILIGVLGALIYALRNSWMKLKVLFLGGRSREKSSSGTPLAPERLPPHSLISVTSSGITEEAP